MTKDINCILIFKTNIRTEVDKKYFRAIFNTNAEIQEWSVDLHDIDCVLRVVSDSLTHEQIIAEIKDHGFECSELE